MDLSAIPSAKCCKFSFLSGDDLSSGLRDCTAGLFFFKNCFCSAQLRLVVSNHAYQGTHHQVVTLPMPSWYRAELYDSTNPGAITLHAVMHHFNFGTANAIADGIREILAYAAIGLLRPKSTDSPFSRTAFLQPLKIFEEIPKKCLTDVIGENNLFNSLRRWKWLNVKCNKNCNQLRVPASTGRGPTARRRNSISSISTVSVL